MLVRALPILLVLAALIAFNMPVVAEDKDNTHDGKVVSTDDGKLTMTDAEGKEHTHTVSAKATITCDGKKCKLEDLKKGTKIRVTTKKGDPKVALLFCRPENLPAHLKVSPAAMIDPDAATVIAPAVALAA